MNFGDRLVVGAYMSPADIGRYVAVFALASVLLLASGPLFLPFYPQLMAAVRADDKQAMARTFSIYSRYLSLSLIPFACYLAVIIGPVQILLAGEEFRVSNLLVVLVVAGVFLDQWNGLSHYVLYCYDKAVLSQNLWLGFGGLNVLLNLAAVPLFGLVGSAAVTLLTFAMLEAWMFVTANRLAGVARHYRWDAAIKAFASGAAGVVAAVAVLGVVAAHAPRVLAATAAFWIVCAAAGIATRAIDRSDLERLLSAVGLRRAMPVQG
jgi:stage V sporulation protein B